MCTFPFANFVLFVLISTTVIYQGLSEEIKKESLPAFDGSYNKHPWKISEDKAFFESSVCVTENRSYVELCGVAKTVTNTSELQLTQCFCDAVCYQYNDCCMNVGGNTAESVYPWKCIEIGEGNISKYPIYVYQMCPENWPDDNIRTFCEVEVADLQKNKRKFSYLQDVPVKSVGNDIFYRNVYCAMCNGVSDLEKWNMLMYCNEIQDVNYTNIAESKFDFSQSVYDARTKRFLKVFVDGRQVNCRIKIPDFRINVMFEKHKPRLCKPVVSTCNENADKEAVQKCSSYSSFVYEKVPDRSPRKVYKNFHCALCNGLKAEEITCVDPYKTSLQVESPTRTTLMFLFDFDFSGGNNQLGVTSPCKLSEGQIWDQIMKRCTTFTCGSMFERKGLKCVPRVTDDIKVGLNDTCFKRILSKESFVMYRNKSILIKESDTLLTPDKYEINEKHKYEVISISVCAEEGSFLLNLSQIHYLIDEVTLSVSIICLILHLSVYGILKELRNVPGKILMCLSSCILCGHIFLLVGQHVSTFWLCYLCALLTYFGYLASFFWMHVMSYDIYVTFSNNQRRNSHKRYKFKKYLAYSFLISISIVTTSILFDNLMTSDNEYKPLYGNPICWFNQRKGLLIFFVVPIFIVLLTNTLLFILTALRLKKLSGETKMVKNFSDRDRYLLYIKLSVVLGLTWILGVVAGLIQIPALWYLFILFNGLQGMFIFISFTLKRKILKKLSVKFKIHSDTYKMGKESAVRRAIYSSLSNLSTLNMTLSTQVPISNGGQEMLKSVKKINAL